MDKKEKVSLDGLRIDPEMKNTENKSKTGYIVGGILLLGAIAVLVFFLMRNAPMEIDTLTIQATDDSKNTAVLTASGYVEPRRKATIAAKITGQIKELFVEEGMKVEQGQVLAKLDDSEAKAHHQSALAQYEVAKSAIPDIRVNLQNQQKILVRRERLLKKEWISQEEYDNTKALVDSYKARLVLAKDQLKAAAAGIQIAQRNLDNCTIRAPFAGIAISKDAQVGEMVSPISAGGGYTRTGISTIVDMNSLEIEVDVNESYISKVNVGMEVVATLDAYQQWKIPARVRTIIPTADRQKATVKVRISFQESDPRILPDMGIKVYFLEDQKTEKKGPLIIVPKEALRKENNQHYVFLLKNGTLEKRAVKVGTSYKNGIAVPAGLANGDRIAADAALQLNDGQKVTEKK